MKRYVTGVMGSLMIGLMSVIVGNVDVEAATLEERVERLEQKQGSTQGGEIGNMVFFRGGGAWATSDRGREVLTDVGGASGVNNGDSGYYIGAGLDLVLSKDVWGMLSKTWVLGEIGVEYKRWQSKKVSSATQCPDWAWAGYDKDTAHTVDCFSCSKNHVHGRQPIATMGNSSWIGFSCD